ncbi:MAG: plmR [Streptosporangiaceae bacterium]|jgi:DNA-binding NarL/FixJ family response regulator|nr:plmR [Streptosporangiaceae bacterium]
MSPISVAVHAADLVTRMGLEGFVRLASRLALIPVDEAWRADVVVVAVENFDACAMKLLRRLCSSSPRFLVVVEEHWSADLQVAVECGVRGVLWRADFTAARFTGSIVSVAEGGGDFPPLLQGRLMDEVQRTYRDVLAPQGLTASGLTEREIDVLRLVSEGFTVEEIAQKLRYSERTVKNVIHGLMKRLNLRNRVHAVAYALRCGLI